MPRNYFVVYSADMSGDMIQAENLQAVANKTRPKQLMVVFTQSEAKIANKRAMLKMVFRYDRKKKRWEGIHNAQYIFLVGELKRGSDRAKKVMKLREK